MRVGHTCCMVDGNFGLLKKAYRHSDIDAGSQLAGMVERSSNTRLSCFSGNGWKLLAKPILYCITRDYNAASF